MFHVKQCWSRLSDTQRAKLDAYASLLVRYNRRVNLISRRTADEVHTRHILECLALAARPFPEKSVVVDWGTGGGLPAVPLAIAFPHTQFIGVDRKANKILALRQFQRQLSLDNLVVWQGSAEHADFEAQYSVARATAPLAVLWQWHSRVYVSGPSVSDQYWAPGLVCIKGGDLSDELSALRVAAPEVTIAQLPVADSDREIVVMRAPVR